MKYKEEFKDWLPDNNVKAVDSYITYANSVEEAFGSIDDYFDSVIGAAIEKEFTVEKFKNNIKYIPENIDKAVLNNKSTAKKYWKFLKDKRPVSLAKIVHKHLRDNAEEK
jgi:hypothetical protein